MLKILAVIVVVVLVVIAGILVYAATRPDSFRVQRSASIKAPPQKIFPLIDDLKAWAGWSPYEKKDPAMKRSFGPVAAGKGATYEWEGNKNVGQGRMEILEVTQPSKVLIKLDFLKPFEAHNMAEFTLEPKNSNAIDGGDDERRETSRRGERQSPAAAAVAPGGGPCRRPGAVQPAARPAPGRLHGRARLQAGDRRHLHARPRPCLGHRTRVAPRLLLQHLPLRSPERDAGLGSRQHRRGLAVGQGRDGVDHLQRERLR